MAKTFLCTVHYTQTQRGNYLVKADFHQHALDILISKMFDGKFDFPFISEIIVPLSNVKYYRADEVDQSFIITILQLDEDSNCLFLDLLVPSVPISLLNEY